MKKALWKSVLAILLLAAVLAAVYLRAGGRWFRLARMLLVYLMLASVSLPALFRAGKGARKLLLSPRTLIFATALAAMGVVYPLAKRFSLPRALAFEALLLFAGAVFFAGVGAFLKSLPGREPDRLPRRRAFLLVAGVSLAVLAIGWLPFFPHGVSPDTQNQWAQIHGQIPYSNIHAIGHTILLKALLSIFDSYAVVIAFHILALSALNGALGAYLIGRGAPARIVLWMVGIVGLAFSGLTAVYYPWKDLPAALCVGLVALFAMRLTDVDRPLKPLSAALFGAALASMWLFRHNGIVALIVLGTYFLASFLRRRQWLQLACASLACVVSIAGIHLYSRAVLHTKYETNAASLQVFGSGLSAIALEGNLTESERAELEELLPMDWVRRNYEPWKHQNLIWKVETAETASDESLVGVNPIAQMLAKRGGDAVRLYFRLLPRNLGVCLKDALQNNYAIYGLSPSDLSNCNGFWALAVLFAMAVLWPRSALRRHWIVPAGIFVNMASIAVSTITNEVRYFLPTFILFGWLVLYAATVRPREPSLSE